MSVMFAKCLSGSPASPQFETHGTAPSSRLLESRRLVQRRLDVIALLGSITAGTSISLNAPAIGLVICIMTLAPLVFMDLRC